MRVGVIVETVKESQTVFFSGYGEVVDEDYPPYDLFPAKIVDKYMIHDWKVKKIRMDSDGSELYAGMEVWWMDAHKTDLMLYSLKEQGWRIVDVDPKQIIDLRSQYL